MNIQLLLNAQDKTVLDVLKLLRKDLENNTSIESLQRTFKLGFVRAVKLVDLLEKAGVVSEKRKYIMAGEKNDKAQREYFKRELIVSSEELNECIGILDKARYDRIKGSILGGAAGDALGNVAEFLSLAQIKRKYGEKGITGPELENGKALITDDTQMLLFTAEGIFMWAEKYAEDREARLEDYVYRAYMDWLYTQGMYRSETERKPVTKLYGIPGLHVARAPGNTCLGALLSGRKGTIDAPINNSKGSGGVMRVAPVGLYFSRGMLDIEETVMLGAKTAAITHGNPLGYIPAAAMTYIVNEIVYGNTADLEHVFDSAASCIERLFPKKEASEYADFLRKTVGLARSNMSDEEVMQYLGEGWCGDSALAIAVYCCMKYDSFAAAVCAAANIDGDSDTVAAIAGNIMGAYLGYDVIPDKLVSDLELRGVLEDTAYGLWRGNEIYATDTKQEGNICTIKTLKWQKE